MQLRPIQPQAGQESVWDYPRPPRAEPVGDAIEVAFGGAIVARTVRAVRVLETSHPPSYYIPAADIAAGALVPTEGSSWCEWKGRAFYFDVAAGGVRAQRAAWHYPDPSRMFRVLAGHVAFYPGLMEACFVAGERVLPQPGGFYGGWVTSRIVGPFKGEPGTAGW